jgi:hypothetical protein
MDAIIHLPAAGVLNNQFNGELVSRFEIMEDQLPFGCSAQAKPYSFRRSAALGLPSHSTGDHEHTQEGKNQPVPYHAVGNSPLFRLEWILLLHNQTALPNVTELKDP